MTSPIHNQPDPYIAICPVPEELEVVEANYLDFETMPEVEECVFPQELIEPAEEKEPEIGNTSPPVLPIVLLEGKPDPVDYAAVANTTEDDGVFLSTRPTMVENPSIDTGMAELDLSEDLPSETEHTSPPETVDKAPVDLIWTASAQSTDASQPEVIITAPLDPNWDITAQSADTSPPVVIIDAGPDLELQKEIEDELPDFVPPPRPVVTEEEIQELRDAQTESIRIASERNAERLRQAEAAEEEQEAEPAGVAITDANEVEVAEAYQAVFGRAVDEDGLGFWSNLVDDGMSIETVIGHLMQSDEFAGKGADDTFEFIDAVYNNAFDRDADTTGQWFWADQIDSGNVSAAEFVELITESAEFQTIHDDGFFLA